ncbi:MAG TPA: beta-galactosidase [Pseudonocardiaceae bacterium]|jgi:hypothetical protein|nr:beta-galactosidase [Pseudonocardiaceae bacterium]
MTASVLRSRFALLVAGTIAAGSLVLPAVSAAAAMVGPTATPATTPIWSTQLFFDNNGTAWSTASFAALRAKGLTTAEIDMPWNGIEPSQGTFNFTELDQELANANAAGMKLIPIFWSSGWTGSPAAWVTSREVTPTGGQSVATAWWDATGEPAYLTYVTTTVRHMVNKAGYGGSILDYGFLDAQWDSGGGASGWAPADVTEFHNVYLPQTYGTIAAFNSQNGTTFSSFAQVPAATPGQALAGVYQRFRVWSVQTTYTQLASGVRAISATTPIYFYYGGHIGNAVNYANIPDLFLAIAKQFGVTIILDSAQASGLSVLFNSLARAYGVSITQEWTAPDDSTQLAAQSVQWIDNYGMSLPNGGGEDFFIHDGTQKDVVGYPIYTNWLPNIQRLAGAYPQVPVAVYVDFGQAYGNTGGDLLSPENTIGNLWLAYQAGFAVVTSQEVNAGIVKLSQYQAILPANGIDANLAAYQSGGGKLVTAGSQLSQSAPAYATLASTGVLQTVPVVAAAKTSAQVTLADITSGTPYNAGITLNVAGLGLTAGTYHVVDASGKAVPQQAVTGGICASANVPAASLALWNVVQGAVPAGTPAPASCPNPTTCGTLTANQSLALGQTLVSCDGRFTLILQGDANLVLYQGSTALWATNTVNSGATTAIMQGDGNFVLYTAGGVPVWASNTVNNPGARLIVQNDGNLVIQATSGAILFMSNTGGH